MKQERLIKEAGRYNISNANKRMAVNSIVHPAVKQEVITRITNNK